MSIKRESQLQIRSQSWRDGVQTNVEALPVRCDTHIYLGQKASWVTPSVNYSVFVIFLCFWHSVHVCLCQCCCDHMMCIFLPRLMPEITAFVVVGLIPLSAPASWTHCGSFCYPQEGRTGASVFGLAMSKSALLVLSRRGDALALFLHECLCLAENNMSSPVSVESLRSTKPLHVWMWHCDGCHIWAKFSGSDSLKWCLPERCCQSRLLLLIALFNLSLLLKCWAPKS